MTFEAAKAVTMIAGEDLRDDVYEILTIENDGGEGKVIKPTATNQVVVGVLGENPRGDKTTDGLAVPVVMLQGIIWVKAGGAITAGDIVIADATAGRVASGGATIAALAADVFALGVALRTAADGDVFPILAQPMTSATET